MFAALHVADSVGGERTVLYDTESVDLLSRIHAHLQLVLLLLLVLMMMMMTELKQSVRGETLTSLWLTRRCHGL